MGKKKDWQEMMARKSVVWEAEGILALSNAAHQIVRYAKEKGLPVDKVSLNHHRLGEYDEV